MSFLYAAPVKPLKGWELLREAGVDLLGTDDLDRLRRHLQPTGDPIGSPPGEQ